MGPDQENRGNRRDNFQVLQHISLQAGPVRNHGVIHQFPGINHDFVHGNLLVHASDHDVLMDGLVRSADEIAVEIDVQIVHALDVGKGDVGVDIVHIEHVLRQAQAALLQESRPVDNRVHEQVVARFRNRKTVPAENLPLRQVVVLHDLLDQLAFLLIDVVGNHEVRNIGRRALLVEGFRKFLQLVEKFGKGLHGHPVVRVHDLVIEPGCMVDARIDARSVAPVFLVDDPHDVRIFRRVFVRNRQRVVLGTVVDDDDFDPVAAGQQGADAVPHVVG